MQRPAKPWTPVRFRPQPFITQTSPGGEIGRRKGLKIPRELNPMPVRVRPRAPMKSDVCFAHKVTLNFFQKYQDIFCTRRYARI